MGVTSYFKNDLLAGLQAQEYERLLPHLEQVELASGDSLGESSKPRSHAYIPMNAVVSLLGTLDDGDATEIAMVGGGGMVGLSLVMGGGNIPGRDVVQRALSSSSHPGTTTVSLAADEP